MACYSSILKGTSLQYEAWSRISPYDWQRLEINCFTLFELHALFSNSQSTSVTVNGWNILLLCISIVKPPLLARWRSDSDEMFFGKVFVINVKRETQKHRMIAVVSLAQVLMNSGRTCSYWALLYRWEIKGERVIRTPEHLYSVFNGDRNYANELNGNWDS